ncbi:MAG: hypothetical protein M3N09_11070 [Actinomycetota bacterium]|nr:hypothetical protein [Actinomycetota bacterium]
MKPDRAAGGRITSARAGSILEPVAERFSLPYTYGDRLRFSGQYVLIAVVALGRATVVKEGRSYLYSINPAASGSPAGDDERRVQSSIAVIGFPGTLEELNTELDLYRPRSLTSASRFRATRRPLTATYSLDSTPAR